MINPATGSRIKMVTQDGETGVEISRKDTIKGFEFKKGNYVLFTEEDFEKVRVESSSLMTVEKFVDTASIDPIYFDSSYYLAPDGKHSEDVYAVLRDAIVTTGKVALSRVVISQRERTIAIRPMDGGLVAHTLNEDRDLNGSADLFVNLKDVKVDPEMVKLAVQLVDRQSGHYDPADLEDRYETRLREMIDAKVKGEDAIIGAKPDYVASNIVDLMAALKKSLGGPPIAFPSPTATRDEKTKSKRTKKVANADEVRRQPGFKLPIQGGKREKQVVAKVAEPAVVERTSRTRRGAS